MNDFFDQYNIDHGIRLDNVLQKDLQVNENCVERDDVIQISTTENLLQWDIEAMCEVSNMRGYDQITKINTYVRSGFVYPVVQKRVKQDKAKMDKSEIVTKNHNYTIFSLPKALQQD